MGGCGSGGVLGVRQGRSGLWTFFVFLVVKIVSSSDMQRADNVEDLLSPAAQNKIKNGSSLLESWETVIAVANTP